MSILLRESNVSSTTCFLPYGESYKTSLVVDWGVEAGRNVAFTHSLFAVIFCMNRFPLLLRL